MYIYIVCACVQRAIFHNQRVGLMFRKWGVTWHNRAVTHQQEVYVIVRVSTWYIDRYSRYSNNIQ